MVLIPGLSCDWTVFDAFMNRNASRYTMYTVTLPGFGGSQPPPHPGDDQFGAWLDNADRAVWKLIEDEKLHKPVIVGHSLGGHLALRLGTEHASELQAVVAIDGAPAFPLGMNADIPGDQRVAIVRQMVVQFKSINEEQWVAMQRQMVANMVTDPARAEELAALCAKVPQATTIQYMADVMAADIRDQLPKLTCPSLVLPSVASPDAAMIETVTNVWTELMAGAPEATLAVFENTRHFIQDDRPKELDAAIADFLAGRKPLGYIAPERFDLDPSPATQSATQPATRPDP
jgi:N-formylmaleamate deformylase